jgi:hypothetical protein
MQPAGPDIEPEIPRTTLGLETDGSHGSTLDRPPLEVGRRMTLRPGNEPERQSLQSFDAPPQAEPGGGRLLPRKSVQDVVPSPIDQDMVVPREAQNHTLCHEPEHGPGPEFDPSAGRRFAPDSQLALELALGRTKAAATDGTKRLRRPGHERA